MSAEYKHAELSKKIIAAAYKVHKELGQGFLEKVYKNALALELEENSIECSIETPLQVEYRGKVVGEFYADIIVENKIILEIKAVSDLAKAHETQLVNYLKATGIKLGLLINFGKSVEVKRRVFGYS